jgi:hypothetical protein
MKERSDTMAILAYSIWGTIVVLLIVIGIVALVIMSMVKDKKNGKSLHCGGNCKHCGGACSYRPNND